MSRTEQLRSAADRVAAVRAAAIEEPTDLGWTLATVLRAYLRGADRVLDDLPGGSRAYRLLITVARDQHPSQLALAHHVGLDRTVVTYLLDGLAANGLIERQPDPADRRARLIALTDAGACRLAEFQLRLSRVEDHVLETLDPIDAAQLRRLLGRVAHNARDAEPTTCAHLAELGAAASPAAN